MYLLKIYFTYLKKSESKTFLEIFSREENKDYELKLIDNEIIDLMGNHQKWYKSKQKKLEQEVRNEVDMLNEKNKSYFGKIFSK